MHENDLRDQIVELGASLFARGFSVGSAGNISARMPGGFLMTPTNSSLGRLTSTGLSVLDEEFEHVAGMAPSKEVVLHRAVYEARPDTMAVVHLHSPYATALGCLEDSDRALPPLTPYHVMRLGRDVPVVRYFRPGSADLLDEVVAAARQGPAVLLANHGSLVAGTTLEDAVNAAEELEASAQLTFLLKGRTTRQLTDEEIAALDPIRFGRSG